LRPRGASGDLAGVNLRARVAVGLGWTGGAHWLGVALATVTTAVVARFLVPADFAVVAAAALRKSRGAPTPVRSQPA
jgi:hypothetical protein